MPSVSCLARASEIKHKKGARAARQRLRMRRATWKRAALLTLSIALWPLLLLSPRGAAVSSEPEHSTRRRTPCGIQFHTWRRSFGHSCFRIRNSQEVLRFLCSFFLFLRTAKQDIALNPVRPFSGISFVCCSCVLAQK